MEHPLKFFYKSILDTVTTSFEDKEKERYTILYLKLLSNYVYDDFDFEKFLIQWFLFSSYKIYHLKK